MSTLLEFLINILYYFNKLLKSTILGKLSFLEKKM